MAAAIVLTDAAFAVRAGEAGVAIADASLGIALAVAVAVVPAALLGLENAQDVEY